jgi:hypothetical protein
MAMAEKESSQLRTEMSTLKLQLDEGAGNFIFPLPIQSVLQCILQLTVENMQQEISKDRTLQS